MLGPMDYLAAPVRVADSQCIVSSQLVTMMLADLLGHAPDKDAVVSVCDKLRKLAKTTGFLISPCSGALCDSAATILLLYLKEVKEQINEIESVSVGISFDDNSSLFRGWEVRIKAALGEQKFHEVHAHDDLFTAIDMAMRKCLKQSSCEAQLIRDRLWRQDVSTTTRERYCRVYITFQLGELKWVTGWSAKNEISAFIQALIDGYRYAAWLQVR